MIQQCFYKSWPQKAQITSLSTMISLITNMLQLVLAEVTISICFQYQNLFSQTMWLLTMFISWHWKCFIFAQCILGSLQVKMSFSVSDKHFIILWLAVPKIMSSILNDCLPSSDHLIYVQWHDCSSFQLRSITQRTYVFHPSIYKELRAGVKLLH